MQVIVSRSGGVAGLRRQWRAQVDESTPWRDLLDALPWDRADADPEADRFVYEITVETRTVSIGESALTGPWRDLVERVRAEAPER